jgi:hypothetical protein
MKRPQRELSPLEREVFDALLSCEFHGAEGLRHCLPDMRVETLDELGSLRLHSTCEPIPFVSSVPVEGEARDKDGVLIHVLLHARQGIPVELEIYKEDGSPIVDSEALRTLDVFSLPPPPDLSAPSR